MYSNGFTGCTDGDIRLTGGGSETEGTVEICHDQTWGMVSGLGWGEEDASPYGKPNLTVLFSSVRCTGSESQITDCATSSLTFEEGRKLVEHIGVADVYCMQATVSGDHYTRAKSTSAECFS